MENLQLTSLVRKAKKRQSSSSHSTSAHTKQ
jgi:hypothetical protein